MSRQPDCYVPYLDYIMVTDCKEPYCYKEAMLRDDKLKWEKAMQSKIDSLHKNSTWELVRLPAGKRVLPCKWIYKLNVTSNANEPSYKARLVGQKGLDSKRVLILTRFSHRLSR